MKTIYCTKCGAENSKESSFCKKCGEQLIPNESDKNKCSSCGFNAGKEEKYCPDCGAQLTALDTKNEVPSSIKPVVKKPKPHTTKNTSIPNEKKGGCVRKLGKVLLWLFALLIVATTILYFMGDDPDPSNPIEPDSSNSLEPTPSTITDVAFDPEPVIGSGSKAFEIEPITGVVLKAKQGALDKNRDFQVEKLTDKQVQEIAEDLTGIAAIPLKGISINSGMKDGEIFPGALEVELSLSEFNIPASMADYLCIIRAESDGTSAIIPSNVENGQISFNTERNSFCLMGILKLVAMGVTGGAILTSIVDDADKGVNSKDFHVINDIDGYTLYYPTTMIQSNPTEVKRVEAIIIDVLKKYNQASETNVNQIMKDPDYMMKFWKVLQKDIDFLEAQKLLTDIKWKQDNLWPKGITEVMKNIRLADDYLFGNKTPPGRGFKRYDNIDIIALDKWPGGGTEPAISKNPSSKQPYIQVNLSKMPDFRYPNVVKGWNDQMLTTLVHEIFHTSQVRYLGTFVADRDKYLWFWEATAVAVEKQAKEYFESKKIISKSDMVISLENSSYCQKNLALIDFTEYIDLQNQGYAYAPLIEYISGKYAAKTGKPKDKYINYVLEKFAELRDPRATLIKTTTNSNHGFEKLYKNFCHENISSFEGGYHASRSNIKFPFPTAVNLTKDSPVYEVDDHEYESLSMTMRNFFVLDAYKNEDYSVLLVLRGKVGNVMSYADGFSIATTSTNSGNHYRELKQPSKMSTNEFDVEIGWGMGANKKNPKRRDFFLQEVNYNMGDDVSRSYEVFAMYKPTTAMLTFDKVTEERWYLKIQYDESNLWNWGYVDAYEITLRCPNGDIYSFITEENELELPTSYDRQTLSESINQIDKIHSIKLTKAGENSTITSDFDLIYRELTSSDAKVMGPYSMTTTLAVDAIVDLTADTDELSIDETINYEVTVTPDKKNYTYDWYIDGLVDQEGDNTLQVNFEEAGTYTAKITVRDENGKNIGSDSWTCTVTSNEEKESDWDGVDGIVDRVNDNTETDNTGSWILYDTKTFKGCEFSTSECYPTEACDIGGGNLVVKTGSVCSNKEWVKPQSLSGSYTVPPNSIIPGKKYKFAVSTKTTHVNGRIGVSVGLYDTSEGISFDKRGNIELAQRGWFEEIVKSKDQATGEIIVPEGTGEKSILIFSGGGSMGNENTGVNMKYLYKWQE